VVFAGGGTGGHLFPGLAVAGCLIARTPNVRVTFAGTGRPLEVRHVAAAGFDYLGLRCRPLPKRLRQFGQFLLENLAGYVVAARFLAREQVSLVVGLGGYGSVPMARAAAARHLPLVLLEQNAVPGRATRWLARRASLVCTAFEQAHAYFPAGCRLRLTGNPIRSVEQPAATFLQSSLKLAPPNTPRQLLVLGGSGGSHTLNANVPKALHQIRGCLHGWRIIHQSGLEDADRTRRLYADLNLPADVVPFIADMAHTLPASHLAIARAGGTTLAELAAAGLPAILVPYPHATDDHQRKNADIFAESGACVVLDEREPAGPMEHRLAHFLGPLLADTRRRQAMAASMRRLARPEAASTVAEAIRGLLAEARRAA